MHLMDFSVRVSSLFLSSLMLGILAGCSQSTPAAKSSSDSVSSLAPVSVASKPVGAISGNCHIETQERTSTSLTLLGWAVGDPQKAPVSINLEVRSGDKTRLFAANRVSDRPDIAKAYKNDSLLKTGFLFSLPVDDAPAGAAATLLIEGSALNYRCKNTFVLK